VSIVLLTTEGDAGALTRGDLRGNADNIATYLARFAAPA
jgi:hypothetical protein